MTGRAEVETRLQALHDLCRKHGVARLHLCGSVTRQDFDPVRSDIDFLVDFQPGTSRPWAGEYFHLKHDLERLFDRPVDLIGRPLEQIENPFLRRSIAEDRELVYAA